MSNKVNQYYDAIIIGGGPAGLAAAIELKRNGIDNLLVIEREKSLGGILNQCIHDGFGLTKYGVNYTGPEYVKLYEDSARAMGIPFLTDSYVTELKEDRTLTVVNKEGYHRFRAKAVILSMGCRERTRGAIGIPGTRPAGIYTAGVAQNFVNIRNIMVGKNIVILGSGDIGLIMARRLTLEGAEVLAVVEKLPYPGGLKRNIKQCLDDFGIPLYLNHTIVRIEGKSRVEAVIIGQLNNSGRIVKGSKRRLECDTIVLSVGLIPENELSRMAGVELDPVTNGPVVDENFQTSTEGIFACGNVLQVHDLVDNVSNEGEKTAIAVVEYLKYGLKRDCDIELEAGKGVRYVVPRRISGYNDIDISFRAELPGSDKLLMISNVQEVLAEQVFKKINPAEMLHYRLNRGIINASGKIVVQIV